MGQPPPPTRYGAAAPAAQMARRPATPARLPTAPGPVMQCFFAGARPAPGQTGGAYPAPQGFRLPAGPGQKLPDGVRRSMEQAFKTDFSGVRIHVGTEPGVIGALAFTAGDRIVMAPGQYAPDTARGQRLLAHELAHVVQQRAGRVRNPLGAGMAIVHDLQLEAEAERHATQTVARQTPVPQARPTRAAVRAPGAPTLQAYFVMGYYSLWAQDPTWKQLRWYPYAVVGNTTLPAQQKRGGVNGGEDQYLDANNTAQSHDVAVAATGASLRVSDDYEMAIEDSNLRLRQPKTFFATDTVLNAAALALNQVNSPITFAKTGQTIKIVGWTCTRTLHEVRPLFNGGSPDLLPQNCNEVAGRVARLDTDEVRALEPAPEVVRRVLQKPKGSDITAQDLRNYARLAGAKSMRRFGANAYAAPEVGEAFQISSVTNVWELYSRLKQESDDAKTEEESLDVGRRMLELGQKDTWHDYGEGVDRRLNWPYHFAGVVAKSGNDRITLENYARGDNRVAGADPRWYFQMYGTKTGQSFHQANKGGGYVNPITLRYTTR